jgi:hypothetical protein
VETANLGLKPKRSTQNKKKKENKTKKRKGKKMVETSTPRGLEPISLPLLGSGYGA